MLGMSEKIRNSGLPGDYPQDIAFRTSLTGKEFGRINIPASKDRYTSTDGPDTSWQTPEPPHRINQTFLEPILAQYAADADGVTLMNETAYMDFVQDQDGVTASISDLDGANVRQLRGKFLIGADGGSSAVRKQIEGKFSGDPVLQNVQSTCIKIDNFYAKMGAEEPRAWGYYTFNHSRLGHVYAINGIDTFLVHTYLSADEAENESVDRDSSIRAILGVDDDFEYEVVSKEDWVARRLVVDKVREGRVFIAGDASHLWVPFAGYGMNAGIADGLNLTWVLGAYLNGWADAGILDAYQAERLPITEQVSKFAMSHQQKLAKPDLPDAIEQDDSLGEEARASYGQAMYDLNVQQFAAAGLNYGYDYDNSPIIFYDDEKAPEYTMGSYTPSTVPGCRAPHFFLADGSSVYDKFGMGYTLITNSESSVAEFVAGAKGAGVPLEIVQAEKALIPSEYTSNYTLVRQDQHVAWRGSEYPSDGDTFWNKLRGVKA